MSYELDYEKVVSCPCGNGKIVQSMYSNDWNQTNTNTSLCCSICSTKYHLESMCSIAGDHAVDNYYLVPNKKTLHRADGYNQDNPFAIQLCMNYPLENLRKTLSILNTCKSYDAIKDEYTRKICRSCKKSSLNIRRITVVRDCVSEAITLYKDCMTTYDTETIRIADVKKGCVYISI